MRTTVYDEKYYGTKEQLRAFLKEHGMKKIDDKFGANGRVFIDRHANMVRVYDSTKKYSAEVLWRYIPYVPDTALTWVGYKLVYINKKQYTMHQIMAHTWLYNPDPKLYTDVDHMDGDKTNNDISNLRWCTKSENMRNYFDSKAAREANGEKGLNSFIKELKENAFHEYLPEKKIYLNLKKKEN